MANLDELNEKEPPTAHSTDGRADIPAENEEEPEESFPAEEAAAKVQEVREPAEDRLLRLRADFENFRRRMARELGQEFQRGRREAAQKLLPVFDSVSMGLITLKADDPARAGLEAVMRQITSSLEQIGIKRIPTVGQPFDPELHEAIANMPSSKHPEGVVTQESRAGFADELGLLRPAQVLVSSGKTS